MNELNREQIVKALECCASDGCEFCPNSRMPAAANCVLFTMGNALSLINELTEENARLRAQNETLEIIEKDLRFRNNELQKANEGLAKNCEELEIEGDELRERIANLKKSYADYEETTGLKQARADTVRKMHSEIKDRCIKGGIYPAFVARTIDEIAEEMLEGIE